MWSYLQTLKRHWAQHFISQSSGFVILFITYSAALLVAAGLYNMQRVFDQWGEISQLRVYTSESESIQELPAQLEQMELVASAKLVTANRAAESFVERFTQLSGDNLKANDLTRFFPSYINIELKQSQLGAQGLATIETHVENLKQTFQEIVEVKYGRDWLSRYTSIFQVAQAIGWLMIIIFLVAAAVVSSSVIKTLIFHHRDEIQVLDFIGADDKQIYIPHILSTLTISVVAFSLAILFNLVILKVTGQFLNERLHISPILHIAPAKIILLVFSICLAAILISAWLTIYRMLPSHSQAGES